MTINKGTIYSFDKKSMGRCIAHGGESPILTTRVLERMESSDIRFIDFTILPPKSDIGIHTHEAESQEFYIILSGSGTVSLDGQISAVKAGDVIVNRPGGTHSLVNSGDEELHMVVLEFLAANRDKI